MTRTPAARHSFMASPTGRVCLMNARTSIVSGLALDLLRRSAWASTLSEAEFGAVKSSLIEKSLPADSIVCHLGDPSNHWIGVARGILKTTCFSETGELTTFIYLTAPEWFGEGALLRNENRRYEAVAVSDVDLVYIPKALFTQLAGENIAFCHALLEQLNLRLSYFITHYDAETSKDPNKRVAQHIVSLYENYFFENYGSTFPVSQAELGALAKLSRQRSNVALRHLKEQGLIDVGYGTITVLDIERLRSFCGAATP
ncbi:MAG: Crp/Fnr family transcriptional regulator [Paracoccaceae bacterium]